MDADKEQQIRDHARAIAALLYEETAPEQLRTLEGIESVVRGHILEHVSPQIGQFLSQQQAARAADENDTSKVSLEGLQLPKSKPRDSKSKGTHS
jgi:hypothetical protein